MIVSEVSIPHVVYDDFNSEKREKKMVHSPTVVCTYMNMQRIAQMFLFTYIFCSLLSANMDIFSKQRYYLGEEKKQLKPLKVIKMKIACRDLTNCSFFL